MEIAANNILEEMKEQVAYFKSEDKLLEAQRIAERTNFDVEMMRGNRLLFRYRELFASSDWVETGRTAVYADGLFPG